LSPRLRYSPWMGGVGASCGMRPILTPLALALTVVRSYDAIVVGAGPAGSVTAYRLASAGASVLLLDRARFPRDKPCGGGLTYRAIRELPVDVTPVVEDVVDRFEFSFRYRGRFVRRGASTIILMTQRKRLDAFLAEQAAAAGAELREGAKVTAVGADGTVTLEGETLRAPVVVGADGVNGISTRALGLGKGYRYGVALEGNVPYRQTSEERYRGRAVLELGVVPGGYAWVFAKGDHVNVGVGGWDSEGPRLRTHLARLCAAHGMPEGAVESLRGYRLPLRRAEDEVVRGRVLLTGDAAGLVDPLSGDGMYEAFVSARLGAAAALDLLAGRAGSLEPYAEALNRALVPHATASWAAKRALDRFPRLVYGFARLPPVWRFADALLRGELRSPGDAKGAARAPLKVVKVLGAAR
jgi:geranylgeranyl reductase family protein